MTTSQHLISSESVTFVCSAIFLELWHIYSIVINRYDDRNNHAKQEKYKESRARQFERTRRIQKAKDRHAKQLEIAEEEFHSKYARSGRTSRQPVIDAHIVLDIKFKKAHEQLRDEEKAVADDARDDELTAATAGDAAHDHAVLAVLSFFANVGCTIGKLFPGHYICETRACDVTVHNALMTLAAGVVDVIERYAYLRVLVPEGGKVLNCIPLGGLQRMVLKMSQLCVTLAWTLLDLEAVISSAPSTGTLVLTGFACAIQLLLVFMDVLAGIRTERLTRKARALRIVPGSVMVAATIGFSLNETQGPEHANL